jgi:hypothetical protein
MAVSTVFGSFSLNSSKRIVDLIPSERRIVLLGESTHGTEEFYRTRAEITKRLVDERGFTGATIPVQNARVNHFT